MSGEPVELNKLNEKSQFMNEQKTKDENNQVTCCRSKHTKNCCIATGVFGCIFLVLGLVFMLAAGPMIKKKISATMALIDGSERLESWYRPPVQPHLEGYAFHVTNPNAVLEGKKPILQEVGPFVYKSTTVKDSDNNVKFWSDATLTYRPRKVYQFVPEKSCETCKNPDETKITVPNIPFWTGVYKGSKAGAGKSFAYDLVNTNGLAQPFIEVSFSGLLWGYEDELPCLKLDLPGECGGDDYDDPWGDDDWGSDEDDYEEEEASDSFDSFDTDADASVDKPIEPPEDSEWEKLVKPKAEFVDCKCNWGLFRDRNITMRKQVRIHTGEGDVSKKGKLEKYDGKTTLGWWKKDSICDKVKGQDSSTLPPGLSKNVKLDIFIALMCRTIGMEYEKDVEHAGINTYRFIPPSNALGRHDDPDPTRNNTENECYCLEDEGFRCLPSGAMYMEPCKRADQAPVALSMPHFYQADPIYRERVGGMTPNKEKHQFYMDVVPQFGFPLAIRPRFQLNVVISGDEDFPEGKIAKVPKDLVLPFLWAQDGFDEPSDIMADKIAFGLKAPELLAMLGTVVFLVIGAILLLSCLVYLIWLKRSASHTIKDSS